MKEYISVVLISVTVPMLIWSLTCVCSQMVVGLDIQDGFFTHISGAWSGWVWMARTAQAGPFSLHVASHMAVLAFS